MGEVLKIVGGIAGVGGLALGVLLLLYRDIVRRKVLAGLPPSNATLLLGGMIVLTFVIAVLGVFAGLAASSGAVPFIVLVVVVLAFVLVVLTMAARVFGNRQQFGPRRSPEEELYARVRALMRKGDLELADRELAQSADVHHNNAAAWYWRARIALARENIEVAARYVDKALEQNGRDDRSIALKIMVLLLSTKRGDRGRAKDLVARSHGISRTLDGWLGCLEAEGMLAPGIRSRSELDRRCPWPDLDVNVG